MCYNHRISAVLHTYKLLHTYSACVSSSLNNNCAYYHLLTILKKRDSILSILLDSLLTGVDCSCSLRAPGVRVSVASGRGGGGRGCGCWRYVMSSSSLSTSLFTALARAADAVYWP